MAPISGNPSASSPWMFPFISATLVLPVVVRCARASALGNAFELVLLVKPQFEVGRGQVGKGGIVRDPQAQQTAVTRVTGAVEELGGTDIEVIDSPILGGRRKPRGSLLHACFLPSSKMACRATLTLLTPKT